MSYLKTLAISLTLIFRIYSRDDSFTKLNLPTSGFVPWQSLGEIQVALPFVRDYDEKGQHTNGVFHAYLDKTLTAQLISDFKAKHKVKANVYASIGGRSSQYPFQINKEVPNPIDTWVSNAVDSLTDIIKTYNLDGIDVYYEHISATQEDFVNAIGHLITKLKDNKIITVASIASSPPLNQDFYAPLFNTYGKDIDTVVYQCHNEPEPVIEPQDLAKRIRTEATKIYGANKLLAGYSAIYTDWKTVLPIVYFLGGFDVLGLGNVLPGFYDAKGASIWYVPPELPELTISNNSTTYTWPNWMLETTAIA